jgi:5'-3' exonuclease
MGIPSYFSHIVKNHRAIIKRFNKQSFKINNLYLDCNSIVYDCLKTGFTSDGMTMTNDQFEKKLIDAVCTKIDEYISTINPDSRILIAFDGVAPVAKLEQQRSRRYKSWFLSEMSKTFNKSSNETIQSFHWDATSITPGTQFMHKLNTCVKLHFNVNDTQNMHNNKIISVSGSDEPGEGEHKIYEYIRNNADYHSTSKTVIYGLDADLIMLTLNHLYITKHMYLFRETPHFIKSLDNTLHPDELYVLDIPELADKIVYDMNNEICPDKRLSENLLFDYIFICFLLGNDFLPHFPAINIRTSGIDTLMNAYKYVFNNENKKHRSTGFNLTDGKCINWKHFRLYISYIAELEHELFKKEMKIRDKWQANSHRSFGKDDNETRLNSIPLRIRDTENYINPNEEGWEDRYYKTLLDTEINDDRKKEICINYLEGLEWTIKYYVSGCADWRWKYNYFYPPLLTDLIRYIPYYDIEFMPIKPKNPVTEYVQLCYVLPKTSLVNLVPSHICNKLLQIHSNWYGLNNTFIWSFCKYFWESHVNMPVIDLNELETIVNKQD